MENVDVSGQLGPESHIGCRWVFPGLHRLNIRGCRNEKNSKNFESGWNPRIQIQILCLAIQSQPFQLLTFPFRSVWSKTFYVTHYVTKPCKARWFHELRANVFSLLPTPRLIFVNKCLVHLHLRQQVVAWQRQACILIAFDKSALRAHFKLCCDNLIQSRT